MNIQIPEKDWSQKLQRLAGRTPACKEVNRIIQDQADTIDSVLERIQVKGYTLTLENFKMFYRAVNNEYSTLDRLFEYHMATRGGKMRASTVKNYQGTRNHLAHYVRTKYHIVDYDIRAIDKNFINEFYAYLQGFLREDNMRRCTANGARKHMQRLGKLLKIAYQNEWIEKNPAEGFSWEKNKAERGYLTEKDLKAIQNANLSHSLTFMRDMFLFSVYTGTSYVDMTELTADNIVTGIDGSLWLNFHRVKTGQRCPIPLLKPALDILDRYESYRRANKQGKLFPMPTNQVTNRELKKIAAAAGIDKNLTFHVARHTFATTVTLSNGIPLETVSRMLGHASIATTQIYAKIVDSKVMDDMKSLREKYDTAKPIQSNKVINE